MGWWCFSVLLLVFRLCESHVRLTFPPARHPALDYYSTANTNLPCGVPKPRVGEGVRTFLAAGSAIDVTWTTVIPHMGGIRLEILNSRDEPIALFTNFPDPYNISDSRKRLELPKNFECANCAIRMSHQATEYGNDYLFFSCADVNILKGIPDGDSCSGHGRRVGGVCQCQEGFVGNFCHLPSECTTSDECGPQGLCRQTNEDPRGQCMCPQGKMGLKCEQDSEIEDLKNSFDPQNYKMREVHDNKIYWRVVEQDIEFVLKFPGQSWMALGWKPKDFECPKYNGSRPNISAMSEVHDRIFTSTEASTTTMDFFLSAIQNGSNGTNRGRHECGPNEQWVECPELSRECEASCDWTRYPETIPNCPRQCGTSRCVCKEGFVRMTNEEETCVPFDFCDKETEPSCPSNSTWAKCGTACEPSCENMYDTSPCPASCDAAACTCADNYVRLNGTCVYWGDCPDLDKHYHNNDDVIVTEPVTVTVKQVTSASSIVRATTRSPPKTVNGPLNCSVNETIVECGRTCEPDCRSLLTRGECDDCGAPACACVQGFARGYQGNCIYWQECDQQNAPTATTSTAKPTPRTKPELEPKVEGDVCYGDFRFPPGCRDCDYHLRWSYQDDDDTVEFSLETRLPQNAWTGVGFSQQGTMEDADMIIVKSLNGKLSVHDMTSTGYGAPVEDETKNILDEKTIGSHQNGVLRAQFNRKRNTGDVKDKQFDTDCWKMLYPVTGGKLDQGGNVGVHTVKPLVSDRQVCIRSCKNNAKKNKPVGECLKEFRHPQGCVHEDCDYVAQWHFDSNKKDVLFNITSKGIGRWTGIGFSRDGQMTNADMYTGWVYESKAYMTDRFAYGRQLPAIDPADRHDIYDVQGAMVDEQQSISFRRRLRTSDTLTDLPLDECLYFLFPIGGGRVLAKKSSDFTNPKTPIGYHDQSQPRVSKTKVCMCDANGQAVASAPVRVRARRQAVTQQTNELHTNPVKRIPHAMDCADMVVASVENGKIRVKDFYSTSKATPRPDSFYGGEDSLTAVDGFVEDGVTTIMFKRKLDTRDKFDHSISPGDMTVLWAKGADPNNYQHTTGGATIKADPNFFSPNAFKYHGKNHRGVLVVDFFEEGKEKTEHGMHTDTSTCSGRVAFPENCQRDCDYVLKWKSDGNVARFTLSAMINNNEWTSIGFSADGKMAKSDVIIAGIQNGSTTVTDQFLPNYGRPIVDEQQDIFDVESTYLDGKLVTAFSRELFSEDRHDVNLQDCVYLLYTPASGVIENNGEIRKHTTTPITSPHKICLNTCAEVGSEKINIISENAMPTSSTSSETTSETSSGTATTNIEQKEEKKTVGSIDMPPIIKAPAPGFVFEPEDPVKARYGLWVRILNKEYVPALADPQSEYYNSFTKNVTVAVNDVLAKRWNGVQVSKILQYAKGSVIAEVELVSTDATPRPIEVKSLFEESAINGSLGDLSIEPSTIKATERDASEVSEAGPIMSQDTLRNIIIIAAALLVLVLCLACAVYLACRVKKTTRFSPMMSYGNPASDVPLKQDSYPIPHPNGYPYGQTSMNKPAAGFENAGFHHNRHYSQTSTKPGQHTPPSAQTEQTDMTPPDGVGETTYQEWYSKVGSKPASQMVEEAVVGPSRPPSTQPYVSYPNEPSGYYTLGGEHRAGSRAGDKFVRY